MAPPTTLSSSTKHTKITADDPSLLPSDEEDDDFTLDDHESDSSSDSEDEDAHKNKRNKNEDEKPQQPSLTKADVDDLWASFNEDPDPYASTTTSATKSISEQSSQPVKQPMPSLSAANGKASLSTLQSKVEQKKKTIKIQVEYQFVGETVTQEKEVPIESVEAQAWLAKQRTAPISATNGEVSTKVDDIFGPEITPSEPIASSSKLDSTDPTSSTEPNPSRTMPSSSPKPTAGPRRAKSGGLGALAASLSKPAKLNTLEKSKLDWNSYVTKEDGLVDSLTHARKGGYLEKQDFLSRTEQAREDAWEKGKSTRKRG